MLLSSSCMEFTCKTFEYMNHTPYIVGEHHKLICEYLDKVVRGEIRKLQINIAPRYGKTLLVSQSFIAYGLALNPNAKFLHLSYSGGLTQENSMAIKDIVKSEYYQTLFDARVMQGRDTRAKWSTAQGGGVYATSTLGQITGFGAGQVERLADEDEANIDEFTAFFNPDHFAGAIVIDDPIKPEDALSDTMRETVNRRFETTIRNRVNSRKTPIIVIMQRVHEHDLCGYLQEIEPDEWTVLSIPCISYDESGNEKALWPFKHTLEELHKIEHANEYVFQTQYMQNPTPMEGLMYGQLKTYDTLPIGKFIRKSYCDTADVGLDFHCNICYNEYTFGIYVTDILYTKKAMEFTEPETTRMLMYNGTELALIESNNGGRIFAKNVERNLRELGNRRTVVKAFAQTGSKEIRIFSRAPEVQNLIFFPAGWERKWPEFYHDVAFFRREGRNLHDDGPDTLTGMVEYFGSGFDSISDEQIAEDFE